MTGAILPRFSCGNCGSRFETKAAKARHKQECCKPTDDTPCPDEDLYAHRREVPEWIKREAARQWAEIPDDPAEIAVWMRLPPVEMPVDCTDAGAFPEIARAHLAAMDPAKRAELEEGWR